MCLLNQKHKKILNNDQIMMRMKTTSISNINACESNIFFWFERPENQLLD